MHRSTFAERRWRKPQPVATWQAPANTVNATTSERSARADYSEQGGEPLLATTFAPSCMAVVTGGSWIRAEVEDEDCLYLNVYTPAGHVERLESSHAPLLPVVVYIHGGGFIMGCVAATAPPPCYAPAELLIRTLPAPAPPPAGQAATLLPHRHRIASSHKARLSSSP